MQIPEIILYFYTMYYRRKVILSLFQVFEGQIDKISLFKLLFLVTKRQPKPEYEFIPYLYGCYSYTANADLVTMVKKGILAETNSHYISLDKTDTIKLLKESDSVLIKEVKNLYGGMNAQKLMQHTYIHYPYYAINSLKAKEILTDIHYAIVLKSKPQNNETILYTIGYEGISLELYFNKLIKNDVRVLVDVRKNPLSMKFGFSKSQLQRYCDYLGIVYIHFPEVGIESSQRQELNTQVDYDKLFDHYNKVNLKETTVTQHKILDILKQHKRIALTCFEAEICQCHRKHLAESISKLPDFHYSLKHI